MIQHLKQILQEENTIIIPSFGAITVTNAKSGEMMYLSYLKYNDKKLSSFIVAKEGISEAQADQQIASFVQEINSKLDAGMEFILPQFGKFFKKAGEIEFESGHFDGGTETTNSNAISTPISEEPEHIIEFQPTTIDDSSKSLDDILNAALEETTDEIPENNIPQAIEPEIKQEATETKIEFLDVPATEKSQPIVQETIAESKIQSENSYTPVAEIQLDEIVQPAVKNDPSKTKAKKQPEKKEKKVKAPKEKKKRGFGFWFLIVLLVIGISGGAVTFFFYDQVKKYIPFLKNEQVAPSKVVDQATQDADSIEKMNQAAEAREAAENELLNSETGDNVATENATPETPATVETSSPNTSTTATSGGGKFHIIVGTYSTPENAERHVKRLGGNASVINHNGKYLVSLDSYETRGDAVRGTNDLVSGYVLNIP